MYGNSHGFLEGYRDTHHSLSCAVLASQGEQMERDFEYTQARDPDDLDSPVGVGREAARRARRAARRAEDRHAHGAGAVSGAPRPWPHRPPGRRHQRRRTVPQVLVPARQPRHAGPRRLRDHRRAAASPEGLASAPYDDEGVATADRRLVDAGVLQGYVLGSYSARKLGMATTGNAGGVHNLVVADTGASYADLLAGLDTGLRRHGAHGQRHQPGDRRLLPGAAGFWVERGEIRFPVSEVTIAGNLRDMYRGILAIGNDVDRARRHPHRLDPGPRDDHRGQLSAA